MLDPKSKKKTPNTNIITAKPNNIEFYFNEFVQKILCFNIGMVNIDFHLASTQFGINSIFSSSQSAKSQILEQDLMY